MVGLPEGMFIRREGKMLKLGGDGIAKLYVSDKPVTDLKAGSDISFLLDEAIGI